MRIRAKQKQASPEVPARNWPVNAKEYMTTQEVAERLGISVFTVRRYIRLGKLKAVRLERSYRVRGRDFEEFVRNRETQVGAVSEQ